MNCKYCNAQVEEDSLVCPVCGKELEKEEASVEVMEETVPEAIAEETAPSEDVAEEISAEEAPVEEAAAPAKANTKKITAAVIALVLVAGILIGLIAGSMGSKPADDSVESVPTVSIPEETKPIEISSNGDPASPQCKASYTVSDEQALASADVVVATMGDKKLTNRQLQIMYWEEILTILNNYGNYALAMGLDVNSPLDNQPMTTAEPVISWQQFMLEEAVASWQTSQALALEAEAENFQMPADVQERLDSLDAELEKNAVLNGFENAEAMIKAYIGDMCTLEDYMGLFHSDSYGRAYYYDFYENLNPSDAEVEAFFAENEEAFKESGITKDAKFVNVRHVLLQPEGGEVSEDGYSMVYTEQAWEACRVKAEELYNKWQEGDKSEESFAELAMANSVDVSAADGGLYEDVYVGQMVPEFEAWCFDESRMPGDHGLVKTTYGYHIMFFSAHRSWIDLAKDSLIEDIAYNKIPELIEKYPVKVDYSLVALSGISFS